MTTARQITSGQNTDIDNAAELLTTDSVGCTQGVLIKALAGNAGTIYIGGAGVTESDGYPLAAGEETWLSIDNLSSVYVIASEADQGAAFIAY